MEAQPTNTNSKTDMVLYSMWRNWALSVGALVLPMFLALFISKTWLPIIVLGEVYVISVLRQMGNISSFTNCSVLSRITIRSLVLSAVIMLSINILCTDWLIGTKIHLSLYNQQIPFLTCLIIFPCAIFFSLLSLYSGLSSRACRECQRQNGYYAGDSIIGTLYYREARYQTILLILISALTCGIEYWYYFARYINTDMNDPDRFFFIYMPLIIYVVSLMFMWGRYQTARMLYHALENTLPGRPDSTTLRFLVFFGDNLLLKADNEGLWDVPTEAVFKGRQNFDNDRAGGLFKEMTDIDDFKLRYCYTDKGYAHNSYVVHYAAFVNEKDQELLSSEGTWFNPYMLDAALAAKTIRPALTNELYRIHTITLAWKTYDRAGKRLYPIKNYRPTFRFRDLKDWKVDYDDKTWFTIAHNNEDKHFYHMRRLWERITSLFNRKESITP